MAWLEIISRSQATGDLAEVYAAMEAQPMPSVYQQNSSDVAGIIGAHSLDANLLTATFGVSATLGSTGLPWPDRELLASTTSRANQCFY